MAEDKAAYVNVERSVLRVLIDRANGNPLAHALSDVKVDDDCEFDPCPHPVGRCPGCHVSQHVSRNCLTCAAVRAARETMERTPV